MCVIFRQCTRLGNACMQSIVVHDCHVHVLMRHVSELICGAFIVSWCVQCLLL